MKGKGAALAMPHIYYLRRDCLGLLAGSYLVHTPEGWQAVRSVALDSGDILAAELYGSLEAVTLGGVVPLEAARLQRQMAAAQPQARKHASALSRAKPVPTTARPLRLELGRERPE